MQATATCIFNKTSISLTNPEIFSVKYNLESPKSRFSQQVKKFSALPILRFRKSASNGEITAVDRRSKGENLSSPLDEKPYELLPGGRRAYLDEQDIVTLLDPPKELIPLDPASYNPAAYLWKKIGDIPEERRHRLLYLLKPRLVSRIWEIAGTRYEDSKLVKKSASSLLSTGDSLLSPEIWSCRTSGGPVPVAWIRDFKKVNSQISRVSYGLFGILKVKQAVTNNISFELGSGVAIRFWEDLWVGETKLKDQFPNIFRLAPIKKAAKIVWDVRSVRNRRDSEIAEYVELLECISKTMPQISEPDKLIWRIDKSSRFTVSSLYSSLSPLSIPPISASPFFWRYLVPPKYICFAWLVDRNRILTIDNLRKRGMQLVNVCLCCMQDAESVDHLLVHCPFIRQIWNDFSQRFDLSWCSPDSAHNLLSSWHSWKLGNPRRVIWRMAILAIWWSVWLERNDRCFNDLSSSASVIGARAKRMLVEWVVNVKGLKGYILWQGWEDIWTDISWWITSAQNLQFHLSAILYSSKAYGAKHPWPFDDYVVVYIRHVGPGVMVGQAWQEGKALVQVPRKFCGEILMVKDYTV